MTKEEKAREQYNFHSEFARSEIDSFEFEGTITVDEAESCVRTAETEAFKAGADWMESIKDKEIEELKDQLRCRSVEEELPEVNERVLCKFITGSKQSRVYTDVLFLESDGKFNGAIDWIKVTHWLPIPRKEEQ